MVPPHFFARPPLDPSTLKILLLRQERNLNSLTLTVTSTYVRSCIKNKRSVLPAAFSLSRPTGVCFITPKAPCPAPHLKITIYTDFVTYFAHANDL